MAKRDLEQRRFNFLLAVYHESDVPPLHRMTEVEALIIERLGENWLNSGRTKDIGFYLMRLAVALQPPDAVVFASGGNRFKATEKFHALPGAAQHALLNSSHDRQHEAVKEGLLTLNDALSVVVQTPERVCQYVQDISPRGQPLAPPDAVCFPQSDFGGRMKMFGDGL